MSRRKKRPPTSSPTPSPRHADTKLTFWERALGIWLAVFCLGLVGLANWLMKSAQPPHAAGTKSMAPPPAKFALESEAKVMPSYAGSESCRECHAAEFEKWKGSHHGLAERKVDAKVDGVAF